MRQEVVAKQIASRYGAARRWNWRTRAHYGDDWWSMPDREISKELRMMSHRRKH